MNTEIMSGSDSSDDDVSSDDYQQPAAKRPRADTYGASSTTSQGSAVQESDDDGREYQVPSYQKPAPVKHRPVSYTESGLEDEASENCSSAEDNRSSIGDHETEWSDLGAKISFGNDSSASKHGMGESEGHYSSNALKMMKKMNWQGKGLGKDESGRVEPVEASSQKGRRGLGARPSRLGAMPESIDAMAADDSKPSPHEEIFWMPTPPEHPPTYEQLEAWLEYGPRKHTIEDETEFCEPHILEGVLNAKKMFDELDDEDLRKARFRSNPFETIGSVFFLNRAAVKMANIDAVFQYMFTRPKTPDGMPAEKGLLYFADVCAGPGGFSEYVLWKRQWKAKGIGFTLKRMNDFKLSDFLAGTPESFTPYYGADDDGDIYKPANLQTLKDHVLSQTHDEGVHFMMADGGFSVEGQENIQEVLSKQLYLCQCLAALMLVRTGGHFVVKLFDLFTPFSVGLVYLMYRCFEKVCIHKPVTSRPANSERYLICKWKKTNTESVETHLYSVNARIYKQGKESPTDITHLVPLDVLRGDEPFFDYILSSNNRLGDKQIKNLIKIAKFCKDKSMKEESQAEMREQCLSLWKLPDQPRKSPQRFSGDDVLGKVLSKIALKPPDAHNLQAFKTNAMCKAATVLESADCLSNFGNIFDWHFVILHGTKRENECKYYISSGGHQVYSLDGKQWMQVTNLRLNLPADTLIYAESVRELKGEGGQQLHTKGLHIIDGVCLGGRDISFLYYPARLEQCALFCEALEKPLDSTYTPIRCKKWFNLESFSESMEKLEFRTMKRGPKAVTLRIPHRYGDQEMFYVVGSLLFMKTIKEPWHAFYSRRSGRKYFDNPRMPDKCGYDIVQSAVQDPITCLSTRLVWYWEPASAVFEGKPHDGLTRSELEQRIDMYKKSQKDK